MKRAGDLLSRIADRENLLLAFHKASRGHRASLGAIAFGADLEEELMRMRSDLIAGTIAVGDYVTFPIRDPKPRVIHAPSFRERVLHHALMNVCEPRIESYLIADTFACRRGKGALAAVERAGEFLRSSRYVLKLDVRKYFDSIDHAELKRQMRRLFKDRAVLALFDRIVDGFVTLPGKGLPIGSLTSQHFANLHLGPLDHHVKNDLRCRGYVRYMDDVLLFSEDRARLRQWMSHLRCWLREELGLEWKTPQMFSREQGVPFLGFRLLSGSRRLTSTRRRRFARALRGLAEARRRGVLTESEYGHCLVSLCSHAEQAHDVPWRRRLVAALAARGLPV